MENPREVVSMIKVVGLIVLFLSMIGCSNDSIQDDFYEDNNGSCLSQKATENLANGEDSFHKLSLNTFTSFQTNIQYFEANKNDRGEEYAVLKTDNAEIIGDFTDYFSNKYNEYQTYYSPEGILVYIRTTKNEINLDSFKECGRDDTKRSEDVVDMDEQLVSKLSKTDKLIIKMDEGNIGEIKDKRIIDQFIEHLANSKMYGENFLCDGTIFKFELYDSDRLLDSIDIWSDGRLMPESLSGGCSYFISNRSINMMEFIENHTDTVFYSLTKVDENCGTKETLIYEDDDYKYYYTCSNFDSVIIRFDRTGVNMLLKDALKKKKITYEQLMFQYDTLVMRKKK